MPAESKQNNFTHPNKQGQTHAGESNPEVLVDKALPIQDLVVEAGLQFEHLRQLVVVEEDVAVEVGQLLQQRNAFFPALQKCKQEICIEVCRGNENSFETNKGENC